MTGPHKKPAGGRSLGPGSRVEERDIPSVELAPAPAGAEWLSASQAEMMCQAIPERTFVLCARAYVGIILTRARHFDRDGHVSNDVVLPKRFWWAKGHSALTQNWVAGDFSTWIDGRFYWQAFGVEFSRSDVEALCSVPETSKDATSPSLNASGSPAAGTPRKRKAQWDDWIAYLALCVADGEIFGNTAAETARKKVADRMAVDGIEEMARTTILSALNRTLEILEHGGVLPTKPSRH